ncbi:MAG: sigma 54-interacting transcriptional regulator [Acidobacteriaceae bacterium]|nr:sigma 54-interacting transcriptional regulator [Acidobacteriaceae bacterium]
MGYGLSSLENKAEVRTVLLASADVDFRARLRRELTAMRWQVREASGGAEAMALLELQNAEAMVLDSVLPDLEVGEFAGEMRLRYPVMDLLWINEGVDELEAHSPRRNELLYALRQAQESSQNVSDFGERVERNLFPISTPHFSAAKRLGPEAERAIAAQEMAESLYSHHSVWSEENGHTFVQKKEAQAADIAVALPSESAPATSKRPLQTLIFKEEVRQETHRRGQAQPLPEMVGESPAMLEMARLIRLVAPRSSTVLIEGETGVGKELVAKAVHSLSARSSKPFVVLNCAAIPEALLEAELFGHTRGAFTGAVQSRTGRIEAANGGSLMLDEIGEMPLALQAKMLRFLESGELQRVGDNETIRVNVRVIAATHQPLLQRVSERAFRLDLYHRLAVFPVSVPALRNHMEDVLPLAEYLLGRLGEEMPIKRLSSGAAKRLMEHNWPGNVRELAHVLERGTILAEDRREIAREEIRF